MATQKSLIKLEGNVGDLTFYKQDDSYRVRQRSGHSAQRIAKDPHFARTRENYNEFGRTSHIAKCIRRTLKYALGELHELFYESTTANRLTQRVNHIVKADMENPRGSRCVQPANVRMFSGFSVNNAMALKDAIYIPLHTTYDKEQGTLALDISEMHLKAIVLPPKTTLFRIHLIALSLDFAGDFFPEASYHSRLLNTTDGIEEQLPTLQIVRPDLPLVVFFGISFYDRVAGYPIPHSNPNSHALDIIDTFT